MNILSNGFATSIGHVHVPDSVKTRAPDGPHFKGRKTCRASSVARLSGFEAFGVVICRGEAVKDGVAALRATLTIREARWCAWEDASG